MTKAGGSVLAFVLASRAFAGTIGFEPQIVDVLPGETAVFSVSITETNLPQFDSISIVFRTDPGGGLSFSFDDEFVALTTLPPWHPPCKWVCPPSSLAVGGIRFATPAFIAPLLIGELSVGTAGLAEGSYEVFVSSSREVDAIGVALSGVAFGGGALEDLEGTGTFNVVPEPCGLVLFVVGTIATAARRGAGRRRWRDGLQRPIFTMWP